MANLNFGVGFLSLVPSGSNPTPVPVGTLQNVSVDISQEEVALYGAYKFPVDLALGKASIKGKAQSAVIGSATIAAILGGTTTSASKVGVSEESGQPVTNTYTVANGATFYEDLGVVNTVTGLAMTRVASAPASGQYSVNTTTGAYTFAAGDANPLVKISYSHTRAATGKTVTLANTLMGAASTYTASLYNAYKSKYFGLRLAAIVIPKLGIGLKNDGHSMFDLEFSAQADSSGSVGAFFSED